MLPDRLTIRVEATDEFVDVREFLSIVQDAIGLLESVSKNMGVTRSVHWRVANVTDHRHLTLTVFADTDEPEPIRAIRRATEGLSWLERQQPGLPAFFSDESLECAKRLVDPLNHGVAKVTLWTESEAPISPTQRVAAQADDLLPKAHDEIGTIEGRLESISVHKQRVFCIWDIFDEARIECRFPDELYEKAHAALRHRVAVTGKIHYNRNGEPVSVVVDEIEQLREQHELPQLEDLEKLNLRCLGDPAEAVRRYWDGD